MYILNTLSCNSEGEDGTGKWGGGVGIWRFGQALKWIKKWWQAFKWRINWGVVGKLHWKRGD